MFGVVSSDCSGKSEVESFCFVAGRVTRFFNCTGCSTSILILITVLVTYVIFEKKLTYLVVEKYEGVSRIDDLYSYCPGPGKLFLGGLSLDEDPNLYFGASPIGTWSYEPGPGM